MQRIGAILGITSLAGLALSPLPAEAIGIHVGPFYFHVPLGHHYHHHHLHMRASPNEARHGPNDVSRGGGYRTAAREGNAAKTGPTDRDTFAGTYPEALERCTALVLGVTSLPIDQIRRSIHPTADQDAALDELGAPPSQASHLV